MPNKKSCRACGNHLTPTVVCYICKEYISWTCRKCSRIEDVTHAHAILNTNAREESDKVCSNWSYWSRNCKYCRFYIAKGQKWYPTGLNKTDMINTEVWSRWKSLSRTMMTIPLSTSS